MKRALALLTSALLAACGGGAGPELTAQPQSATAPAPLRVLTLGDSTTTPVYDKERSVPGILADQTGWLVTNIGVSGTTACMADLAAVRKARADVATANYAINDSALETLAHGAECWQAIVQAAHDAGSVLVIVESNPVVAGGQWSHTRSDAARRDVEAVKQRIADATGSYYCRLPALPWSLDLLPDGVHPGALAKPAIAAQYANCITRAL